MSVSSASRSVVVTGATGHIGINVVRALLAQGRKVRVLKHSTSLGLDGLDVEQVPGGLLDPASLRAAFANASAVFNCAGVISLDGDRDGRVEAVNVVGAQNVGEACLEANVERLVHFSSIQAYQQNRGATLDENAPLAEGAEHYAYDRSKARSEQVLRRLAARGLHCVIVNPTAVVGPYDYRPSRMGRLLLDLAQGRLPATVNGGCDFVDVRDVARTALVAERRGRSGVSYFIGGTWHGLRELADVVAALTDVPSPRGHVPMWLARLGAPLAVAYARLRSVEPTYTSQSLAALRSHRKLDCTRARAELGHVPRAFEQTIADTLRWFGQAGMLAAPKTSEEASSR